MGQSPKGDNPEFKPRIVFQTAENTQENLWPVTQKPTFSNHYIGGIPNPNKGEKTNFLRFLFYFFNCPEKRPKNQR